MADNARKILDEYKKLFGGAAGPVPDAPKPKQAAVRKTDRESMAKKRERLRELKAKKREKSREMQRALDDLIPDLGSTRNPARLYVRLQGRGP